MQRIDSRLADLEFSELDENNRGLALISLGLFSLLLVFVAVSAFLLLGLSLKFI